MKFLRHVSVKYHQDIIRMKKRTKIIWIVFLWMVQSGLLFAQQSRLELGNKYFDQFDYKKAIILYEDLNNDQKTWKIYARLGDCYYNTSRPETALKYYEQAINANIDIDASYLFKYALCLQSAGKPKGVVVDAFQKYLDKTEKSEDINAEALMNRTVQAQESLPDLAEKLSINSTSYSDFGTFIFNDTLYFSSSRENPKKPNRLNKKLYRWNEQPFLDMYSAALLIHGDSISYQDPLPPERFDDINTVAHEAYININKTGDTMYFSRGMLKNKYKMDYNEKGTSTLKLERATLVNGIWEVTEADKNAMNFLDYENYSLGNPALSPNGERLFFVSCAPFEEAKGKTDIYYIDIKNGKYSAVKSVPGINTNGRESFPYVSQDGDLYFSSDGIINGELGFGLLDIYKVKDIDKVISENNDNVKMEHLPAPFNGVMDDFGLYIDEQHGINNDCQNYWYFSSNRGDPNTKRDDDIYRVKMEKSGKVVGHVTDVSTQQPLMDASVDLIDVSGKVLETTQVDTEGSYQFDVECGQSYRIRGSMSRYYDDLKEIQATSKTETINLELKAFPCEITIDHIEFDLSSDLIRPDAKRAISEVLEILLTNPDVKVSIESHTDSRGPAAFNLDLSERRAQSTKAFLIGKGVKEEQILSVKGFGETCLLISDEEINNAPMSERNEMHEKNRRSRFILDCQDKVESCQDVNSGE